MSNARILADLMGTSTTVPSSKLSLGASDLPSGSVLQVKSAESTATQTISSNTRADGTGLTVTLTPSSSSSKFLIMANVHGGAENTGWYGTFGYLVRVVGATSTDLFVGDAAGSRSRVTLDLSRNPSSETHGNDSITYLDSPATTSSITYKLQFQSVQNTSWTLNGWDYSDTDNSQRARSASSITVMEIAG